MGLHFSRLALAIALCLPLASSLHAAEQLDEFYTEIKGPDNQTSPLVVPQQKPVVENGELKVGTVMACTLSVDHRAIDGALAAQWLAAFQRAIEAPLSMLI